ncbi:MAG: PhoH family protein [Halanaerobiales bacterium]
MLHRINQTLDRKSYIIDTSVLLYDAESIFQFSDHEVIIPSEVLIELDSKKSSSGSVGVNARQVVRYLKKIFFNSDNIINTESCLNKISAYNNEGIISLYHSGFYKICSNLNDLDLQRLEQILNKSRKLLVPSDELDAGYFNDYSDFKDQVDFRLLELSKSTGSTLVTNDNILQLFAIQFGINCKEYKADKTENKDYTGYTDLTVVNSMIDTLYKKGKVGTESLVYDFTENEFVNLKTATSQAGLARYIKGGLYKVDSNISASGISALNKEQLFALNILLDKNIELIALTGVSGVGKTLLALAAGLQQVDENIYKKMLVSRPTVALGKELGFLPGSIEEKLHPWLQPIYDNLEFIYGGEDRVRDLKEFKKLKVEPLQYIRGRSIPNQFFVIDESQNISPKDIKAIISRAGEGTKIVMTGDVEQIDEPYLSRHSNALSYVIDNFKGQDNFAHIRLTKTERSRLASQGATLL